MAKQRRDHDTTAPSPAEIEVEKVLKALQAVPVTTLAGRLKPLLPVIDQRQRDGVRLEQVVEILASGGIPIQIGTLRKYLTRYRQTLRNPNAANE